MKKTIVALLCVAPIACFAMEEKNNQPRFRDIPRFLSSIAKSQERQADAAELQAVSMALIPCFRDVAYRSGGTNLIFGWSSHESLRLTLEEASECQLLKKRYDELIIKNQNNS
jgi:hypothetical protein